MSKILNYYNLLLTIQQEFIYKINIYIYINYIYNINRAWHNLLPNFFKFLSLGFISKSHWQKGLERVAWECQGVLIEGAQ